MAEYFDEILSSLLKEHSEKNENALDSLHNINGFDQKKFPNVDPSPEFDTYKHTVMRLESEIEALQLNLPMSLPDDTMTHLKISEEQSQKQLLETEHTLLNSKKRVEKLMKDKNNYEILIKKAEDVNDMLDKLSEKRTEAEEITTMKMKYESLQHIFQTLKTELGWYINSRYPDTENVLHIDLQEILQKVTEELTENPNDPYVEFDMDGHTSQLLNKLVSINIMARHPEDCKKFKLLEFRDK